MFDTVPRLRCGSRELRLDRPRVMGVLNVTPDSFSDGGRHNTLELALARAAQMADGVDVIDVGGESTRPGANPVSEQEEIDRVCPVIEALVAAHEVVISVDTFKPAVMRAAIAAGVHMVNDIQALRQEGAMDAVAGSEVAVVLMHAIGGPYDAGIAHDYADVAMQVRSFLAERVLACEFSGISRDRLLLDPGYGFAKDTDQNVQLLARQAELLDLGLPLLAGLSRKRCIGDITGRALAAERMAGSLAAHLLAVQNGAMLVRTHDVAPTVDALRVVARMGAEPSRRVVPNPAAALWGDED